MKHQLVRAVFGSAVALASATAFTSAIAQEPAPASAAPASSAPYVDHDTIECERVPKEEMRPQMELKNKLTAEGWRVRQIKSYQGCYEVYGFDEKGERIEAFFHPKTFENKGKVKM